MTHAVANLLEVAKHLSGPERAELTDRLVESLGQEIPDEIEKAQLTEVRRRIAQVETADVALIPGHEALAQIRGILAGSDAAH